MARRKVTDTREKKATLPDAPIEDVDFVQENIEAYRDYGNFANYFRAIPNVCDGFRYSHRRITYDMMLLKLTPDANYVKSARIVGDVLGRFHPHGDASVYNTMVGMSQDFTYKYPFIDGHGNWGTLRDSAAAYRYTEARLTPYAEALLGRFPSSASRVFELDENTVPTRTVQAGYEQEPEVLPALFPNFVVNPILGIGAAMQSKTAGHNINEALAAAILIVDSPNARPTTLREKIPGPDMPTSCDIFDTGDPRNGIESYMTTGRGSFIMRARYHFEDYQISARKKGTQIIVTGLPYGIDGEDVVEGTQALLAAGKLPQEISVADFTDRSGVRVVFDIAELDPQETINQLLFHSKPKKDKEGGSDDGKKGEGKVQSTFLQFSYAVNMNAIVNNEIRCIGVFDALREWVAHRRRVVKRRSTFRKDKAEARLHVVDGYLKAIPIAEKIIEKVRESNGREEAHKSLVSIWKFSDIQASAILDMSIIRIAKMGVKQLADEKANLEATIDDCSKLLNEPLYLNKRLKEEMRQIQKDLGRERTCRLMEGSADIEKPEEVFIEVPAEAGYLIRTKNNLLRWVARLSAIPARLEGDIVVANDALDTNCAIECVTSFGNHARMYPEDLTNRFMSAKMLFKDFLQPGENIILAHSGFNWEYDGAPDLVMITEFGGVKRISFEEWNKHTTRRATDCITLDEGDSVVQAFFLPEGADIVIGTHNGLVIKIDSERVLAKGRKARSLPAIKLESGDSIAFAGASYEGYSAISYWTDEGNFAAFSVDEVKYQSRGGKGISLLSIQKGAHVVGGSVIYDAAGSDSVQVMYQDASGEMTEVDVPIRAMKLTKRTLTPLDGIGVSDVVHVSGTPYQEEHDNADE